MYGNELELQPLSRPMAIDNDRDRSSTPSQNLAEVEGDCVFPSSPFCPSPQYTSESVDHSMSPPKVATQPSIKSPVTSPRPAPLYSGKSSESLYSPSTSPLEYKSANESNRPCSIKESNSGNSSSLSSREGTALLPSNDSNNKLPITDSSTPIKSTGSHDLFLKLKSSQILRNASKPTPSSNISPQLINDIQTLDLEKNNSNSSFHDSLESPVSELGMLEDFVPDLDSLAGSHYPTGTDGDDMPDSFMNDDTQYLVDKATSFKHTDMSIQNTDELPIGVKKEKSVIDSLKQEIFQLKLHIVIMETQLNTSSDTGVAQLKSRLAESEAARIAMKNENDKLRQTMATLNEEEADESTDKILALEEELLQYETALGDAQEEQDYIKVCYCLSICPC